MDGQISFCYTENVIYKSFKITLRPIFSRTSDIREDLTNILTPTDCQMRHKETILRR